MDRSEHTALAHFVIFEGVDGAGKTTLTQALRRYYQRVVQDKPLYVDNFPGSLPGTLGEWVYRLHHARTLDGLSPAQMAPPALQLLHVAAHVDTILNRIAPTLAQGGYVILDRYWWSTYAYSRPVAPPQRVWAMVGAERAFWAELPAPVAIYLTRRVSLKADQINAEAHRELDTFYQEVVDAERQSGVAVHQIHNDGTLDDAWAQVLRALGLPWRPLAESEE